MLKKERRKYEGHKYIYIYKAGKKILIALNSALRSIQRKTFIQIIQYKKTLLYA